LAQATLAQASVALVLQSLLGCASSKAVSEEEEEEGSHDLHLQGHQCDPHGAMHALQAQL
jgi:hypothetical protein